MMQAKPFAAAILLGALALAGCDCFPASSQAPVGAPSAGTGLKMELPGGWEAKSKGDTLVIAIAHYNDIIIRTVPAAATPADALAGIAKAIVGEVHDFTPTATHDLTLAGKPAKHVLGKGKEADDGDPSNTEVFAFTVGSKVYTACVHGEGTDAEKLRPAVMKALDSTKAR